MSRLLVPFLAILLLVPRMALAEPDAGVDHRAEGDRLVKEQKWEAALGEYDEAAEATPGDARLQSDRAFVAMRAGYFDEAMSAALAAVAATREPRRLSAALYNYGWALETLGAIDASAVALAAYAWAHVLDPGNRVITSALAATAAAFAATGNFEADPKQEQLAAGRCARVLAGIEPWAGQGSDEIEPHCEAAAPVRGKLPAGLAIVMVRTTQDIGMIYQKSWYLLTGRGASWRVLARLGGQYVDDRPQGAEISGYERFSIDAATVVKRGARRVLALDVTYVEGTVGGEGDFADGGGEASEHVMPGVLYCVLDAEVRCPVQQSREGVKVSLSADGAVVATPRKGPPTRTPLW
jgi:hypothetical protein